MINLFFVEAPFQLISAHEAAKTVPGKKILIIRKNGQMRNDEQLQRILDKSMSFWDRIVVLNVKRDSFLRTFSFYLNIVPLLYLKLLTICEKGGINVVAMGDFRSGLWNLLYRFFVGKKLWLLDDGIALLNFYGHQKGKLILDPSLLTRHYMGIGRSFLKRRKEGIVFKTFMDLDVYAPFELEKVELVKAFASEKLDDQKVEVDVVYFVGAKLVEENIISSDDYFNICGKVAKHFSSKKVIYFPHRDEDDKSVNEIQKHFGFDVVRPSLPLEFYICQQSVLPNELIGFSSAAICTISAIYPHVSVHLIELDNTILDAEFQAVFDVCHVYIESKCNVVSII